MAELNALTPLGRTDGPARLAVLFDLINASQRLMDGRFADASSLNEKALRVGGPDSEAAYFHVVYTWEIAELTGDNLEYVETRCAASSTACHTWRAGGSARC